MSNPAQKPADKSSAIAPRSHRTRGPRLLLTTSEHARLSKMAKRHGRPMARYARERALAHAAGPPTTYGTDDAQSIRNAGRRLNRFMHRINYTDGKLYSGQRKDYGQKWIHPSEVQAEIRHLEAFLDKLPHHVGRSYWRIDRALRRERRTYWGTVRCTPEEHTIIREKARAAGMSEAGFIRAAIFGWPTGHADHRDAVSQLCRFENNLRQLQNWWRGDEVMKARIHRLRRQIQGRVRELTSRKGP